MSTMTDNSSLPDVPEDTSHGSSVSTTFVNAYEEILKHAIVAPKIHINEDVYKVKNSRDEESSISSDSKRSQTTEGKMTEDKDSDNYTTHFKISEAKEAVRRKKIVEKKQLRFKVPNALDSLLEYTDTPCKDKHNSSNTQSDSTDSTPEGLHRISPPSVDKDLIRMDSLMDEWNLQLKRNVLAELADMKARQYQYEENVIHEIKLKHNAEMLRLTHEVESLKELLYSFEQNVKQKDEVIKNLTEALNKQKEKSDKIRLFSMWRLKHTDEQRQEFSSKMADKFYKRAIMNKVWIGWRNVVESKWKQRVEKACQIKSQEVCIKLTEDYEERLQALQRELSAARSEVAKMHTERDCYEENMKKAFMRGVCALNMEAMSMFHEGKDEENNQVQNTHYPCTVAEPSSSLFSQPREGLTNKRTGKSSDIAPGKHVTFSSDGALSNRKPNQAKPSANKKDLHVKMTARSRKDGLTGSGAQSSISSIKVERHVPPNEISNHATRPSNSLPVFAKEQSCDRYNSRKTTGCAPTIKVVD